MENLARYIIRASFSQERMTYLPDESKVVYRSKDGKSEKTFDALEWLAAMCSHVPSKGYRKNWARLIQKIYEVDPLACPRCKGEMRIMAFIEGEEVIKKILQRRTSPQAPRPLGGQTQAPTPDSESAALIRRAPYRLLRLAGPTFR